MKEDAWTPQIIIEALTGAAKLTKAQVKAYVDSLEPVQPDDTLIEIIPHELLQLLAFSDALEKQSERTPNIDSSMFYRTMSEILDDMVFAQFSVMYKLWNAPDESLSAKVRRGGALVFAPIDEELIEELSQPSKKRRLHS